MHVFAPVKAPLDVQIPLPHRPGTAHSRMTVNAFTAWVTVLRHGKAHEACPNGRRADGQAPPSMAKRSTPPVLAKLFLLSGLHRQHMVNPQCRDPHDISTPTGLHPASSASGDAGVSISALLAGQRRAR